MSEFFIDPSFDADMLEFEPCPHCGMVKPKGDFGWRKTDIRRATLVGQHQETYGTVPYGGLFPRVGYVNLKTVTVDDYRYESMWVRTWGEREWRQD